ncbi:MAG: S8 family serine peptidase [Aquimonas sp.]|nr:S8 family serine peptidase [Aquimonas sp.]
MSSGNRYTARHFRASVGRDSPCPGKQVHRRPLSSFTLLSALLLGRVGVAAEVDPTIWAALAAQGKTRIIVNLLIDDAADRSATAQAEHVHAAQQRLLDALGNRRFALQQRYQLIPALALEVDDATLRQLAARSDISQIEADIGGIGHGITVDESLDLNGLTPLLSVGADGNGMKVAILDSGIDTDHPDFSGRIVAQACFCSGCCPGGSNAAEDNNGHGTWVSGIIAGDGDVAPRGALPNVQIVAVKVLAANQTFQNLSSIISALDWVRVNHPDVDAVNMSLGTDILEPDNCDTKYASLTSAINNLRNIGAVVSASSGNQQSSNSMSSPACIRNVMGTAAAWDFTGTGSTTFCSDAATPKKPACFSNRSTTTDLYAAGAYLTSTAMGGGIGSNLWGTSFASPMVAACAIALKQAAPNSTVAERENAMRNAPTQVTDTVSGRSYPFLDCINALSQLIAVPDQVFGNGFE